MVHLGTSYMPVCSLRLVCVSRRSKVFVQCFQAALQMVAADPGGHNHVSTAAEGPSSAAYVLSNDLPAIVPAITVDGHVMKVYCTWVQAKPVDPTSHIREFHLCYKTAGTFDLTDAEGARKALRVRCGVLMVMERADGGPPPTQMRVCTRCVRVVTWYGACACACACVR